MVSNAMHLAERPAHTWPIGANAAKPQPLRRLLSLAGAANGGALVERVSGEASLDASMRQQLVRILTVTVQDWMRP